MAVELTGRTLSIDDVVRVARGGERVEIGRSAIARMEEARSTVQRVLAAGAPAYGFTTGVGMRRDAPVAADDVAVFSRATIYGHRVGLGELAREEVVRASILTLANGLAAGYQGVRPEIAARFVDALNERRVPEVRSLGSLGEADLAQNADVASAIAGDLELEAGEACALLISNAFSTGHAALAVADTRSLLDACDAAGALDFEALRANVGALHPGVADARPHAGVRESLTRLRTLLEGSALWEPGAARFLQDPLSYRCLPQVHGACRDALRFVEQQLAVELNAHQGNPLVVVDAETIVSVGNFDSVPLAHALDLMRIALAPVLTTGVERTLKLLSPQFSGLTHGLTERGESWEDGLAELGVAAPAIAAEARLLAHPVSFELTSTMQESGVEDRTALSSLGARRLDEMLDLGSQVVAIELVVAAQAVDLRGGLRLGAGARATREVVRRHVPFLSADATLPLPLEELARAIRSGVVIGSSFE